jgi:predicted ferric reductase
MNVITDEPSMTPVTTSSALHLRRQQSRRIIDAFAAAVGLGLGAVIALAITGETWGSLTAPGGVATFLGRLSGLTGAYLMLVMLLLIARVPFIEKAVGQDRLVMWHRNLGQWPVYLLLLHALLLTVGYAQFDRTGVLHQAWLFIDSYPDVLMAAVALGLIVAAAVASIRAARRKMRYETWWTIHLYLYLALALSFAHQFANGLAFVGHPLTRYIWATLWAVTVGTVLMFRFALPIARTMYHDLRVESVREEGPGIFSIVCSGRHLERLGVAGGQFFQWRFLKRGLWYQACPFSLSAMPMPPYLRVTIKSVGAHSKAMRELRPGTRVAIEGPYGGFTQLARSTNRVLLIGAGVGVTPIRALLEDLEAGVEVVVITRASTPQEAVLDEEMRALVEKRGGKLHQLVGSRQKHSLNSRHLKKLVPDIYRRDVYVCGPEAFTAAITASARDLGVAEERIHCEQFGF